jgi:hypothetical protein
MTAFLRSATVKGCGAASKATNKSLKIFASALTHSVYARKRPEGDQSLSAAAQLASACSYGFSLNAQVGSSDNSLGSGESEPKIY